MTIIRRRWKLLMIGRCWRRGLSSSPFQRRRFWPRRQTQMGKVPARPQTRPARNLSAAAGDFRARTAVRRFASRDSCQIPTGRGPGPAVATLQTQIDEYRQEIRLLFADILMPDCSGHCPAPAIRSRPGSCLKSVTTTSCFLTHKVCNVWRAPAGSFQSGQIHRVHLRRQCNKSLRTPCICGPI